MDVTHPFQKNIKLTIDLDVSHPFHLKTKNKKVTSVVSFFSLQIQQNFCNRPLKIYRVFFQFPTILHKSNKIEISQKLLVNISLLTL